MAGRKRGVWPLRQTWYSICSAHQEHDPECDLCQSGWWYNDVRQAVGGWVFRRWPRLWRWWVNRK